MCQCSWLVVICSAAFAAVKLVLCGLYACCSVSVCGLFVVPGFYLISRDVLQIVKFGITFHGKFDLIDQEYVFMQIQNVGRDL